MIASSLGFEFDYVSVVVYVVILEWPFVGSSSTKHCMAQGPRKIFFRGPKLGASSQYLSSVTFGTRTEICVSCRPRKERVRFTQDISFHARWPFHTRDATTLSNSPKILGPFSSYHLAIP